MVPPAIGTIKATRLCSTVTMATAYQQNHIHSASTRICLIEAFAVLASVKIGQFFTVRVSHLTRSSIGILFCVNLVVLGNFDPLVGLHTGLAQPFSTLHTKAYGSCIVLATCAHLRR